jgi:hypothetical protein
MIMDAEPIVNVALWPAPGLVDTKIGVRLNPEGCSGTGKDVHAGVQA